MASSFILSCESTVDMTYEYVSGRNIPVLFYSYLVDGVQYADDMERDPEALKRFYGFIEAGKLPSTSQLNTAAYEEFFEEQLKKGDLLHVALGTGMTLSYNNAAEAARNLAGKYPDRKLVVVDSTCSSSGYGLLVDQAADMRDQSRSLEETEQWLLDNRKSVHHQFFSTRLDYYRRSGRMSGAAAAMATILGICPIMRLDDGGRIIAYDKVRGKKRAVETTVNMMEKHARGGADYSGKCFICNSDCREDAEALKEKIEQRFAGLRGKVRIWNIGTIIASHCGPGTVAVFFMGDEREPDAKPADK